MEKLIIALYNLGYLIDADKKSLFNLRDFSNRLFYQKLVFLLCEKSKSMNFSFNWYKRGPYSPDLTKELFSTKELTFNQTYLDFIIKSKSHIRDMINDGIDSIETLKRTFKESFKDDWKAKDLEILASLVFINKYTYSKCKDKNETIIEFKKRKPELKDEPLEQYIKLLEVNSFL